MCNGTVHYIGTFVHSEECSHNEKYAIHVKGSVVQYTDICSNSQYWKDVNITVCMLDQC